MYISRSGYGFPLQQLLLYMAYLKYMPHNIMSCIQTKKVPTEVSNNQTPKTAYHVMRTAVLGNREILGWMSVPTVKAIQAGSNSTLHIFSEA